MAMQELKRKKAHREWLMRNLTTSLFLYERVVTTRAKAKELRRWADRLITLGKKTDLASSRRVRAWLAHPLAAKKLAEVLRTRFTERPSGFTRMVRLGVRKGDGAERVLIELLPAPESVAALEEKKDEKSIAAPAVAKKRLTLKKPKATVTVRRKGGAQ